MQGRKSRCGVDDPNCYALKLETCEVLVQRTDALEGWQNCWERLRLRQVEKVTKVYWLIRRLAIAVFELGGNAMEV